MLALLDSLLTRGFDTTDQAQRIVAWYRDGKYAVGGDIFDVGSATSAAIFRIEEGVPAEEAGLADEMSCGNGSLMRILPIALVHRFVPASQLVDEAHRASKVTHGHHRPQVACALYVLIARQLLRSDEPEWALASASSDLRDIYSSPDSDAGYLAALEHLLAWPERERRGRVWDSFWSAWDAFEGADSYEDAIKRAIAYGNDTDTTAAICGGLAGIRWGIRGIPAKWLDGMRGEELAGGLVERLTAG